MNSDSINYHYKSYELFKIAKIVLQVTNVANRGTFGCHAVTIIEDRDLNATFFWNIQIFHKSATLKSMLHWREHLDIFNTEHNHWDIEIRTNQDIKNQ